MADLSHRLANDADRNLVLSSWKRSFRSTHYAGPIPDNLYYDVYESILQQLLDRQGVKVLVAYKPGEEAPYDVYGWLCHEAEFPRPICRGHDPEAPVVHYCYVKEPYRGCGVARFLFNAAEIDPLEPFYYTFRTTIAGQLTAASGSFCGGRFKPQLVRRRKPKTPIVEVAA